MIAASKQVSEIRKLGQKKATEILNDLMQTAMGMVALYQRKVMTSEGIKEDAKLEDIALFKDFMLCAGTFAKALGPFQDPVFKAVQYTLPAVTPVAIAPENAKVVGDSKVKKLDDPAALGRIYADMVKRVA